MGGQIWIESEGLDKGTITTFLVKLGMCKSPSDALVQPVGLEGHADQGNTEFLSNKQIYKDDDVNSFPYYERNF